MVQYQTMMDEHLTKLNIYSPKLTHPYPVEITTTNKQICKGVYYHYKDAYKA